MPYETCHLAPIASWADRIKGLPIYRWANVLHYVNPLGDHPSQTCNFGSEGWVGKEGMNVLGGIRNTTDILVEGRPGANEALKFLVHFMGDLHQPLHLTGRDKGGNGGMFAVGCDAGLELGLTCTWVGSAGSLWKAVDE